MASGIPGVIATKIALEQIVLVFKASIHLWNLACAHSWVGWLVVLQVDSLEPLNPTGPFSPPVFIRKLDSAVGHFDR